MLQQNNNNNYPCLNGVDSTPEMLQKCSRASLPFPRGLELGLGDLPLIRGLRAWAVCSKNRRKSGGLLGGGQAPTAPPAGYRGSTSCPRPADVYLSKEWGHMAYGLPLGPDAGHDGIRALVTVATLKTSEGSGKTQTQCLFLQTEKGSCLYSTAKPVSGVTTSAASGVVGGWLKGKTGGGGNRDTPVKRRDQGSTPATQTGANRVRVRSGRRWRKSCNPAGREKAGVSRDRQQSRLSLLPVSGSREIIPSERQEEQDKGGPDSKQFSSPQQDIRRARHEKEGAFRSPKCCHNASRRTCTHCGRKAQRRESQDDRKGGESPRRSIPSRLDGEMKSMKKERYRNEEVEKGGLSSNSALGLRNPDLEPNRFHTESHSSCDTGEIREAKSNEEMDIQTFRCKDRYLAKEEDANSEGMKVHRNNDSIHNPCEQVTNDFASRNDGKPREDLSEERVANANGLLDLVEAQTEKSMKSLDFKEGGRSISQTSTQFSVVSDCCEDVSVCTCPASICTDPYTPIEGSIYNSDLKTCVLRQLESRKDHLKWCQRGAVEHGIISKFEQQEQNCVADENKIVNENRKTVEKKSQLEESDGSSIPPGDPSIFETHKRTVTENSCNFRTTEGKGREHRAELAWENGEEESQGETVEQRTNPEEGEEAREIGRKECTCAQLHDCNDKRDADAEEDINVSAICEADNKKVSPNCALEGNCRLQVDGCSGRREEVVDTCEQTSITHGGASAEISTNVMNVAYADPSTSPALSLANPAPSLPLLGSMTTSLPCLEAGKEEEEGIGVSVGEGGQEGKRRHGTELEEQSEEKRGSTVATEQERKDEEEEDEFGVFMQAEGVSAWSEGSTVPCGSGASGGESHGC